MLSNAFEGARDIIFDAYRTRDSLVVQGLGLSVTIVALIVTHDWASLLILAFSIVSCLIYATVRHFWRFIRRNVEILVYCSITFGGVILFVLVLWWHEYQQGLSALNSVTVAANGATGEAASQVNGMKDRIIYKANYAVMNNSNVPIHMNGCGLQFGFPATLDEVVAADAIREDFRRNGKCSADIGTTIQPHDGKNDLLIWESLSGTWWRSGANGNGIVYIAGEIHVSDDSGHIRKIPVCGFTRVAFGAMEIEACSDPELKKFDDNLP